MVNDTISDMLTRIRNANLAKHETVFVLNTKTNQRISEILKKEGYIEDFLIPEKSAEKLQLTLKYLDNLKKPCITNLKRLSSPGLRIYSSYKEIPRVLNGMGVVIVSTSKGLMTDREARLTKIGGELLCSIW
uniref:Small ribosomal subunit protein uS8c n=1 Tax=Sykidion marinum TaxID=44573 RepID=A0A1W6EGL1_SYKMA|nr:ribosomal protein S8 [Pseudoneochloris marina]ARK14527.1 ribosomal protein S8 [Pseudoneochloris marina]